MDANLHNHSCILNSTTGLVSTHILQAVLQGAITHCRKSGVLSSTALLGTPTD